MKKEDLIERLQKIPGNPEVIISSDSEGNSYTPLECIDPDCIYVPESDWFGDVYSSKWTAEDAGMEDDEWEEITKNPKAIVLYP